MRLPVAWLLILWFGIAGPARAQSVAPGEAGLRARMAEFLRAVLDDGPTDPTERFFPTTGDWRYTHTVHEDGGRSRAQPWIFPAAQTSRLFGFDEDAPVDPVWDSFQADQHGRIDGLLVYVVEANEHRRWRLVGRNRFVPPGASASSPVFVEWRREGGRWVISAFGDERFCGHPMPGHDPGDVLPVRRLPAPARPDYAADQPWYVAGELLHFEVQAYAKYGAPRELRPGEVEPMGWKGDVRVYAEKGQARSPLVLYVPSAPGIYQPYLAFGRGRDPYCAQ